jgi:DNA replication protein DnaC
MGKRTVHRYATRGIIGEIPEISILDSYLIWRGHAGDFSKATVVRNSSGNCTYCNDIMIVNDTEFGMIHCVCRLKEYENELNKDLVHIRSSIIPRPLAALEEWGSNESVRSINRLRNTLEDWIKWPDKWVTIWGVPGTGKTHAMSWLSTVFGAWSLYITDGDFEQLMFEALKNDTLIDVLEAIKRVPILLYDDLGASHGSDFAKSSLRKVYDSRYKIWNEKITVTTTNLGREGLYRYDQRIADRILDEEKVTIIGLYGVTSWRTKQHANGSIQRPT